MSNNCLLKIVDATDSTFFSQTSSTFALTNAYLNFVLPNGGETLTGGTAYTIQFNNSGTGNINLFYSINNGLSWDTIATNQWQGTNGLVVNSVVWQVPLINAANCIIKAEGLQSQIIDYSNSFAIVSQLTELKTKTNQVKCYMFPNPATDVMSIVTDNQSMVKKLTLRNAVGAIVLQKKLCNYFNTIDLTQINRGIYYVEIVFENGELNHEKLIIK
jgi:hypothetical protein